MWMERSTYENLVGNTGYQFADHSVGMGDAEVLNWGRERKAGGLVHIGD